MESAKQKAQTTFESGSNPKHLNKDYDVIIVGGGPTGVALGIELGLNNISTLILEKYPEILLSPRAQFLNARSMELFMRWNLDAEIQRRQLLPPDFPIQGVWCSKLNGQTYAISSSNDHLNSNLSPQRGVRIPLWLTEEVLRSRLHDLYSVTFLINHTVIDVQLNLNDVLVIAKDGQNQLNTFRAQYVVACDGANSITRKKVGIEFKVLAQPRRVMNIMFESRELEKLITVEKGFIYYLLESRMPGVIGFVDAARGLWYAQIGYEGIAETIEQINLNQLLDDVAGMAFDKKIIQANFWNMHIQLAECFSKNNRLFLMGDSAHAFAPTGGFGLNTGLGNVVNLGWKLAAVIKQIAKPTLLETYEQERRPVCLNNLIAAQKNADDMMTMWETNDPNKDLTCFAKANMAIAKQHTHSLGATMGYAYFNSPLTLLQKEQSTTPMKQSVYQPIVAPGYFLPHSWLELQTSIYDLLSETHWSLIISNETNHALTKQWREEFNKYHVVLDILNANKHPYPIKYILIRPDWHIAFACNELNNDYLEYCIKIFFNSS